MKEVFNVTGNQCSVTVTPQSSEQREGLISSSTCEFLPDLLDSETNQNKKRVHALFQENRI